MNLVMRSSNQLWKNIANEGNAFEHNCKNDLIFLISFIKNNSIGLNIPCRSHILAEITFCSRFVSILQFSM